MKHLFFCIFFLLSLSNALQAQNNYGLNFNRHFKNGSILFNAGQLGEGEEFLEVNLFSFYGYAGLNNLSMGDISDFLQDEDGFLTEDEKDYYLNLFDQQNFIGFGADISPLSITYKLPNGIAVQGGVNLRVYGSAVYSKNLIGSMLYGNDRYSGDYLSIDPLGMNGMHQEEYYAAASFPIQITDTFHIKPFVRVKYISSAFHVNTEKLNLDVLTDNEGRYIDIDYEYNISTSGLEDGGYTRRGSGVGMDLGLSSHIHPGLIIDVGLMELGTVKYTKDVTVYRGDVEKRYRGLEIEDIFNIESIDTDSLEEIFEINETEDTEYSTGLRTKYFLQVSYGFVERSKKGRDYFMHNLFFNFSEILQPIAVSNISSMVAGGYVININNNFNVGTQLGYGGIYDLFNGYFFSFEAGAYKFGVGLDNILPLISDNFSGGTGISFNMALAFNRGSKDEETKD